MNPEQEKLLSEILSQLVAACYREMGQAWCTQMIDKINELKNVGKQ